MLSIIVSSYQEQYYLDFEENLRKTCGIPYEIVRIWNPGTMSIYKAYNHGLVRSKYPYLLFVHEDVLFDSSGWGEVLVKQFEEDENVGLIGLAGVRLKTRAPSAWYENGKQHNVECIKQYDKGKLITDYIPGDKWEKPEAVVVIDGVFIAMRKATGLMFDERLDGFHNYDLSISLQAKAKGWKILVVKNILLSHFSMGNFDREWLLSAHCFYQLYRRQLPLVEEGVGYSKQLERNNYLLFFHQCLIHHQNRLALYYLFETWKIYFLTLTPYMMFVKLLVFQCKFFFGKRSV
ncbi:glycosyltransferase [Pedobacter cryoconitis]|uniref:Streptomycin biosynthesis protein StrF domain-containing protein n=1 Tax=Pedobacter cryoconitis TaxID=188932 RepID=A0A7X0MJB1_9SPHI|nr:glycosyltransferase [Pedobacter cryoconitis]MBB6500974.1 hypothetical protein [Pedobacter cryoconitis]